MRKLLVYDSYTLFWQKLRFEIFGRVRGGTPRSIFSDFDILAFNLRLDPPWRPNGPSERVLKPTMPSPTFDSEHISPKQPFSKVIISDPGKHLKFRIFLKIGIHGQSHISETERFNPLKSNSPLYKPHQKKPLQERNFFFFLKKFTQPLTADFAIFGVPRLPGKGGPEGKSATAIPFLPSSRYL